jgi:hypothetical protein
MSQEIEDKRKQMQEYVDTLPEPQGPEAYDRLVKITIEGNVVTSSSTENFLDCVPLVYTDFFLVSNIPDSNVSGGTTGGGQMEIKMTGFIVPQNAALGATFDAVFKKTPATIEYIKLHEVNNKKVPHYGYTLNNCAVIGTVHEYKQYQIIIVSPQKVTFERNKFDENGVKLGKESVGHFDASNGSTAAPGG